MPTTLRDSGEIRLIDSFVPDSEELFTKLVAEVAWDSRMAARKAMSFGVPYNYSGTTWPAAPFPDLLLPVLARVTEAVGFTPNNCLAHYYPSGDSTMGFHSDATDELEPNTGIAIVSLGVERAITFRRINDKTVMERYPLPAGSLLWMSPGMQAGWKHAILTDSSAIGGRGSLTFRQMKTQSES
jgi:alkylated DNA repair dioxygenase AlkB